MRFEKDRAEKTRASILDAASKLFRLRGFDRVGVADLMGKLGMTHGGFYVHFGSKSALAAEVCSQTLERAAQKWGAASPDQAREGLSEVVKFYLSKKHCKNPESGCLATALGADVGREPVAVRRAFTKGLKALIQAFAGRASSDSPAERQREALVALSGVVGAVVLARAVTDRKLSSDILVLMRDHLLRESGKERSLTAALQD